MNFICYLTKNTLILYEKDCSAAIYLDGIGVSPTTKDAKCSLANLEKKTDENIRSTLISMLEVPWCTSK